MAISTKRYRGTVINFLARKGYGFIHCEDDRNIFVHYSDIRGREFRTLVPEEEVEFNILEGPKGPQATDVVRLNPPLEEESIQPITGARKW